VQSNDRELVWPKLKRFFFARNVVIKVLSGKESVRIVVNGIALKNLKLLKHPIWFPRQLLNQLVIEFQNLKPFLKLKKKNLKDIKRTWVNSTVLWGAG